MAEGGKDRLFSLDCIKQNIRGCLVAIQNGNSPFLHLGVLNESAIPFAALVSEESLKIRERKDLRLRAQKLIGKVPESRLKVVDAYSLDGWGEGNVCIARVTRGLQDKDDEALITFLESQTTEFN